MDFDVKAFINAVIHGDDNDRRIKLSKFTFCKLHKKDELLLFNSIKGLIEETSKESPQYQHLLFLNGLLTFQGIGQQPQYDKAIKLFDEAIGLNNSWALIKRAVMHEQGLGGPIDYQAALFHYKKAIEIGNQVAQNEYQILLNKITRGKLPNHTAAIKFYEQHMTLGNLNAIANRALMYTKGLGGPIDCAKAITLNEQAIAAGNTYAMTNRARMYANGQGGPVNFQAAIKLFDQAIALGDARAMRKRATLYITGQGQNGMADYKAAAALLDQAIALGDQSSMAIRAEMYKKGLGGPTNYIRFRVLLALASRPQQQNQTITESFKLYFMENTGFYNLICFNINKHIDTTSIIPLADALSFLNSLPPQLPNLQGLKNKIYNSLANKIIPLFPIFGNFHARIQGLSAESIFSLMHLIKQFAKHAYNEEGIKQVEHTLHCEAFSRSRDPKALNTLKTLAKIAPEVNYWVALYYLNNNPKQGLFEASAKEQATNCLSIAASEAHSNVEIRRLAADKLLAMRMTPNPAAPSLSINSPNGAAPLPTTAQNPSSYAWIKDQTETSRDHCVPAPTIGYPSVASTNHGTQTAADPEVKSHSSLPLYPLMGNIFEFEFESTELTPAPTPNIQAKGEQPQADSAPPVGTPVGSVQLQEVTKEGEPELIPGLYNLFPRAPQTQPQLPSVKRQAVYA